MTRRHGSYDQVGAIGRDAHLCRQRIESFEGEPGPIHPDAVDHMAAGEERRPCGGALGTAVQAATASPISQLRGAASSGQIAGSIQWVGQSQSANET